MSSVSADSCRPRGRYLIFLLPKTRASRPPRFYYFSCLQTFLTIRYTRATNLASTAIGILNCLEIDLPLVFRNFSLSLFFSFFIILSIRYIDHIDHNENDDNSSTNRYRTTFETLKIAFWRKKFGTCCWIVLFFSRIIFFPRRGSREVTIENICSVTFGGKKKKKRGGEREKSNAARTKRCLARCTMIDRGRYMHARIFRCLGWQVRDAPDGIPLSPIFRIPWMRRIPDSDPAETT